MSSNVYLQEARTVIAEFGAAFNYDFCRLNWENVVELHKRGMIGTTDPTVTDPDAAPTSTCMYEPIGGHFMGQPVWELEDTTKTEWTPDTPDDWEEAAKPFANSNDDAIALSHIGTGDWTVEEAGDPDPEAPIQGAEYGEGRMVRFVTYNNTGMVTLFFGGCWKLQLYDGGNATLSQQESDSEGGVVYTNIADFDWMSTEEYLYAVHWLMIYEVRGKLVIRNATRNQEGKWLGLCYNDPSAQAKPEEEYVEDEEHELDDDGEPIKHALRGGKWKFKGSGPIAFCCSKIVYTAETSYLWGVPTPVAAGGSTEPVSVVLTGAASDNVIAPTVTCYDQDAAEWPQSGAGPDPAATALAWRIEWTTSATDTYFLSHASFVLPRTTRADGNTGTDVLALSNVADKALVLSREGDLTRERFQGHLRAYKRNLAAYVRANMSLRYVVNGSTVFRGLTDRAVWGVIADTSTPTGDLHLSAEGLWKTFRKASWPGGEPFDGRLLTAVIAEVVEAAGLTSGEYAITASTQRLPSAPEGESPALVYRPGTSIDRILEDLRAKFYGTTWIHYFRLSDGKFIVTQYDLAAAVTMNFYQSSALAVAAGKQYQVILDGSYQETLDESEMANVVAVIGQRPDGTPLLARCVDWSSIRDSTVWNYVNEPWFLIVADPGLQSQAAVNLACRRLFDRHRYPRIYAQWKSIRTDVFPGQIVGLVGGNYGDTYLLKGITFEQASSGDAADPLGRASYSAEVVR